MAQAVVAKNNTIRPKFTVEELDGVRMKEKRVFSKEKKTFEVKQEEVTGGYLLKFPAGHSIVVDTLDEVKRLVGDPETVEMINVETSDVHGVTHQPIKRKGAN